MVFGGGYIYLAGADPLFFLPHSTAPPSSVNPNSDENCSICESFTTRLLRSVDTTRLRNRKVCCDCVCACVRALFAGC